MRPSPQTTLPKLPVLRAGPNCSVTLLLPNLGTGMALPTPTQREVQNRLQFPGTRHETEHMFSEFPPSSGSPDMLEILLLFIIC